MHETSNIVDQATALRELALNQKKNLSEANAYIWAVTSGKGGGRKECLRAELRIESCGERTDSFAGGCG